MRNIFIIGLIVVSMGYMVYILVDRFNNIVAEEEKNKKVLQQKQQQQQLPQKQ